ncbi:hypothetical protein QUF84_13545 [Fictibacillus enclensis]|uniref:hypothetical protein n=1 Tax=Fictibacillus enclensis TaxID=1017270 RepID=UPI0024C0063F|nr:hypothetical protein [Fictibacillus enclensis]MDM5199062.1 hypothetical protein [Fictibacillus enclensis]MDM5338245.1 hypothetical protein [Fictibacillus enclensis]WHY74619.1 hypothetical protein QNH15_12220 [Fictibacillus enclensis]
MAFGLQREELQNWKAAVKDGEIAFLTHFWYDPRFPDVKTVTKVGCRDLSKLEEWGRRYGLKKEWIDHHNGYPHFDLMGTKQSEILKSENKMDQLEKLIKKGRNH